MAIFSRKQAVDDATVVDEAQVDYLDAPDTVGRPMALVSIILIVLLIAALLFASFGVIKWLNNRNNASTTVNQNNTDTTPAGNSGGQNTNGETSQPTGNSEPANNSNTDSAQTSNASGNATVPTAGGVDEPSSQTNGASNGQLPNTGASANVISLFIVTTFGSEFAYRFYLSKKLS